MSTTVARLTAVISADTRRFDAGITRSEARMQDAHRSIVGASAGITAGLGYIGFKAVSAAADFEQSLNVMTSVSGATGAQMKEVSKLALKLGNDVKLPGASAKDASEAMVELSKAGMSVDQVMKAVRPTLVLSAAAGVSNARAAEIAANALNAFGLDASKTTKVTDLLANAANASSLEIDDAADSMKMAGAVFAGFQGPAVGSLQALKELTTATALLGNAGIKGSDAGTSLKQMLLQLTGPSGKAADQMKALYYAAQGATIGEDELNAAMKGTQKMRGEALESIASMNKGLELSGNIAYNASGEMRALPDIIDLVSKATKNMTQEQQANAITQIFGADASRAVISLMKVGAAGWDEMSDKINVNGAAQELATSKMKGMRGAQEALKSSLDTLAITFGQVALPAVTAVMRELTAATGVMAEHKTETLVLTGVIGGLAASVLAAWTITKIHAAGMLVAEAAQIAWSAAVRIATGVQWLFNAALEANPIGIVVVALAGLTAGVILAYQHSETFRRIVNETWTAIKDTVAGVTGWLTNTALPAITGFVDHVQAAFAAVKTWLTENWKTGLLLLLGGLPGALWIAFTSSWGEDFRAKIVGAFDAVHDWISDNWKTALIAMFGGLPGALWAALRSNWGDELLDPVKTAFRGVRDWIKEHVVDAIVDAFNAIPDRIGDSITSLPGKALSGAKSAAGDLADKLNPFHGDASDPGMLAPFTGSLMGALPVMGPFAAAAARYGLTVTSGLRPGAITKHGTLSDHAVGKALDVSGSPGGMAGFFQSLIGNSLVKQAFYDPLGSIFAGALNAYREGGHDNHVHVATYDDAMRRARFLMPGWNFAYNGTGRPEPVGSGAGSGITVNVHGSLIHERDLVDTIRSALLREQQFGRRLSP